MSLFFQAISMGGWVSLLRNWAGFLFCFCYHFLQYTTDFRFLYWWDAVVLYLMWGLECLAGGCLCVPVSHSAFSSNCVVNFSKILTLPNNRLCCLLLGALDGDWGWGLSHFAGLASGLGRGCIPLRDRDLSAYLPLPWKPNSTGFICVGSWLGESFLPHFSSSKPLFCISVVFWAQELFFPILQQLEAVASSEGGSGKCVGCCAYTTVAADHHLHTCTTLGHSFQYPLLHQSFHVLLVKAHNKEFVGNLELSLCLGLPVILNWYSGPHLTF